MALRHRLRSSPMLIGAVARLFAGWIRFCQVTTRWTAVRTDDLTKALQNGPVIVVLWHEHLMMAMPHWSKTGAPMMSLHDTSPIGRVAGAMEARFGFVPIAMSGKESNIAMSRLIKRNIASGISIGITGDGPEGPRRICKTAPLDWARATDAPVFLYSMEMSRCKRLKTWDKMVFPLPFGRGSYGFRRWDERIVRRTPLEKMEQHRISLEQTLNSLTTP